MRLNASAAAPLAEAASASLATQCQCRLIRPGAPNARSVCSSARHLRSAAPVTRGMQQHMPARLLLPPAPQAMPAARQPLRPAHPTSAAACASTTAVLADGCSRTTPFSAGAASFRAL
eukprot:TRINITY_DN18267_c0_g1_i1.p4 TRINITY_DN18267_c0_g1~~TRINITY_DN18267_c0_g1_i1.p4  ORF type:complete len:118 (-),score=22.76 TRINITY_DN18267_c0_g1_i1:507-860(-)